MYMHIITSAHMTKPSYSPSDVKTRALRASGTLHPAPGAVKDELFAQHEFFDPRDHIQVKYEMVRRHRVDGEAVTEAAKLFGVSRQAFYQAQAAFESRGIAGLIPRQRGPKGAHKCTDEILDYVERRRKDLPGENYKLVAHALKKRFGVSIHPRTLDRALTKRKKKRSRRIR